MVSQYATLIGGLSSSEGKFGKKSLALERRLVHYMNFQMKIRVFCLLLLGGALVLGASAMEQEAIFPPDAGVVNVTLPPYNAKPDGRTDCTEAIQRALNDFAGRGIIYLPKGTYIISDTLRWGRGEKRNILQGQSQEGTVIKLADQAAGFQDPTQPKAMIWTGRKPAQRFRNGIRNLTIDTGKGNPGAIGAQFIANNQGGIHHVTIRSGDGSGPIGLDLAYTPEEGPFLVTYLTVKGFDVGIANSCPVDSVTFENLFLEGQNRLGIDIDSQVINIRKMRTKLQVPVVKNYGVAVTTIIESEFEGQGPAAQVAAISNSGMLFLRDVSATGYGRLVDNEAGTRRGVAGLSVKEYTSHPPSLLFPSPPRSLRLPIKETPEVPWDDPKGWTSILKFGPPKLIQLVRQGDGKTHMAYDWSEALQKAIDSGATTIYFPNRGADQTKIPDGPPEADIEDEGGEGESEFADGEGASGEAGSKASKKERKQKAQAEDNTGSDSGGPPVQTPDNPTPSGRMMVDGKAVKIQGGVSYGIYGPIYIRNKVRRIIGMESDLDRIVNDTVQRTAFQPELVPTFILEDGEAPVVIVERFNTWYGAPAFHQKSKRTLVISSMSFYETLTEPGSGDVFLHDVRAKHIAARGTNVWGRQINPEGWREPRILVDGGMFWCLGLKTETDATIGIVRNGGRAEIVGGFFYANKDKINPKTMWVNEDSDLSFIYGSWKTRRGAAFHIVARETRDGVTREIRHEDAIPRGEASALTLYTGSRPRGQQMPADVAEARIRAAGSAAVALSWKAPVAGADGVAIERRNSEGNFELVRVVSAEEGEAVIKNLAAGSNQAFRLKAFSGAGEKLSPVLETTTDAPLPPGDGTGLKGEYFSGLNFTERKAERTEPLINMDWGSKPPPGGLKADRFSARWTGSVVPRLSEPFTFVVEANYGARLYVNGELIADSLHEYSRRPQHGTIELEAGKPASLRLEYVGRENPGAVKLSWRSPNTPLEVIPTTQLKQDFPVLPVVSLGRESLETREDAGTIKLAVKREGGDINAPMRVPLDYGGEAVAGTHYKPLPDHVIIPAGASAVDLAVDLINNTRGEPDRNLVVMLAPEGSQIQTAGRCVIKIIDDDMPPAGNGTGWNAEFFQDDTFKALVGQRQIGRSDIYWDKKTPFEGIDTSKPWSTRWSADLLPLFSETYRLTLHTGGYGNARLYVNERLVIDNWEQKGINTANVELKAGQRVRIRVEMKQSRSYGARLGVHWSSPSQYLQPIPSSQLFPNSTPTNTP